LSIYAGQKVALVGRTGSGKSTLGKLLLGLYTPTEGEIEYDGVSVRLMNLQSLRRQWGTALQDPFLFSSSVRENISFNNPEMPEAEIVRAAMLAEVHDDILQMPMGYETRLDEAAQSLSGGQRQRLAIARAVAGNPAFLLLDESTSHLDTMTEAAVDRNLDALSCTRVVIAHRLSTVQNADLIVVLEDGSIVEQGSHHQLLARAGVYAELIHGQVSHADAQSAL
jgi:ABC-type bacteriocin/lantibiotic exporter with double-glycine peptidase domain